MRPAWGPEGGFRWELRVVLNGTRIGSNGGFSMGPEGGFKWDLRGT